VNRIKKSRTLACPAFFVRCKQLLSLAWRHVAAQWRARAHCSADVTAFSALAGGYATYGASAIVSGNLGAVSYITAGAGGKSAGNVVDSARVTAALKQVALAQSALSAVPTDVTLGARRLRNTGRQHDIRRRHFVIGVYQSESKSIGAGGVRCAA